MDYDLIVIGSGHSGRKANTQGFGDWSQIQIGRRVRLYWYDPIKNPARNGFEPNGLARS